MFIYVWWACWDREDIALVRSIGRFFRFLAVELDFSEFFCADFLEFSSVGFFSELVVSVSF